MGQPVPQASVSRSNKESGKKTGEIALWRVEKTGAKRYTCVTGGSAAFRQHIGFGPKTFLLS